MIFIISIVNFGWYTVVGKRVAPPIDVTTRTVLSPGGTAGFSTDGTTLLSTI